VLKSYYYLCFVTPHDEELAKFHVHGKFIMYLPQNEQKSLQTFLGYKNVYLVHFLSKQNRNLSSGNFAPLSEVTIFPKIIFLIIFNFVVDHV
jgi:hypothetical protein